MLKKFLAGIGVGAVMLAATLQPAEAARMEQFVRYNYHNDGSKVMVTAEAVAYHTTAGCFMYINGFQYIYDDLSKLYREGETRTVRGNAPYVAVYGLLHSVPVEGRFGDLEVETADSFNVPKASGYTAAVDIGVHARVQGYAGYLYDFYLGMDENVPLSEVLGGLYKKSELSEEQLDEQLLYPARLPGGMAAYIVKKLPKVQARYRRLQAQELHFDYAGVATEYEYPELKDGAYYVIEATNDNQELVDSYLVQPQLNKIYVRNGKKLELVYAEQEL